MPRQTTSEFFVNLVSSPRSLEAFHENPSVVGRFAGIDDDLVEALGSKNVVDIQKAVLADSKPDLGAAAADTDIVVVIII